MFDERSSNSRNRITRRVAIAVAALLLLAGAVGLRAGCPTGWYALLRSDRVVVLPSESISVGDTSRHYRLVVPKEPPDELPIVFAFHGTGGSAESLARHSGLDGLVARHRIIVVYPQALRGMWFVDPPRDDSDSVSRDVRFFDALLEHLRNRYSIDEDRIHAVGLSNGGAFAQRLAVSRGAVVASAVVHSGCLSEGESVPEQASPILFVVGAEDGDATAEAMRRSARQYQRAGPDTEFLEVEDLGHEWARRSNQRFWRFLVSHPLKSGR